MFSCLRQNQTSRALLLSYHLSHRRLSDAPILKACPVSSEPLKLELIQIIHRHGDRTPILPCLNQDFWSKMLPNQTQLHKIAKQTHVIGKLSRDLGVFGALTSHGIEQMQEIGAQLRSQLLDSNVNMNFTQDELCVYSTAYPRTLQSVQALLAGLYPLSVRGSNNIPIDVTHYRWMVPDAKPRNFSKQLAAEKIRMDSNEAKQMRLKMNSLQKLASEALYPLHLDYKENTSSDKEILFSWKTIQEWLTCLHAIGYPFPSPLTDADRITADNVAGWFWYHLLSDTEVAKMATGPFLDIICKKIEEKKK